MKLLSTLEEQVHVSEPRSCQGCDRPFPKGTLLLRRRYRPQADSSKVETEYWCPVCLDLLEELPPDAVPEDGQSRGKIRNLPRGSLRSTFPMTFRLIGDAVDVPGVPRGFA